MIEEEGAGGVSLIEKEGVWYEFKIPVERHERDLIGYFESCQPAPEPEQHEGAERGTEGAGGAVPAGGLVVHAARGNER